MSKYIFVGLSLVLIAVWTAVIVTPDNKLHVVVCDVGQGDAILIWKGYMQMLVDSGPNSDIQACLGSHMPFYDRSLDVVILTHPDADHVGGMAGVVGRYKIDKFFTVPIGTQTTAYQNVKRVLEEKRVEVKNIYAGDVIRFGDMEFEVVWPERKWVAQHISSPELALSTSPLPLSTIMEREGVLGLSIIGVGTNEFSIGGVLRYGEFEMMFTGDADIAILDDQLATGLLSDVDVLKVAHHGSKFGTTSSWLSVVRPELAVVSVGKNNRYGHPTAETVGLLESLGIKLLRTDLEGEIQIVSDGYKWWNK